MPPCEPAGCSVNAGHHTGVTGRCAMQTLPAEQQTTLQRHGHPLAGPPLSIMHQRSAAMMQPYGQSSCLCTLCSFVNLKHCMHWSASK